MIPRPITLAGAAIVIAAAVALTASLVGGVV
ncbi:hypothetical protein GGQ96_003275 [Sphingomonas abaci]|uniref:Uncharacterized protein n=1 Tax=Sphingomonas abaci TaxID=237611 RepID=A0A7W7AMZ2_9SPHN|nr:hypothetical protein [Sphingomonas abaci]